MSKRYRSTKRHARMQNRNIVKNYKKGQRKSDLEKGYNYIKERKKEYEEWEKLYKIIALGLVVITFLIIAVLGIVAIQEITMLNCKPTAKPGVETIEINVNGNIYINTNEEDTKKAKEEIKKKTQEQNNLKNEEAEKEKNITTQEPEIPTYSGEIYSDISQFEDWEIVNLQQIAVAEGGFTENAMQACAFSVIQTARDNNQTISQVIYSGKYACVKKGKITINGHEVTKEEYSYSKDAVRRAIVDGAGEIGEELLEIVEEKSLDVEQYYGCGPTYFYKEELLNDYQKQIRSNIKAKVYDEECGMYFYTYWDQPKKA